MFCSLPQFDLTIVSIIISLVGIIENTTTLKVHAVAKEIPEIFSLPTVQPQT
jgi:hypothetical protein